MDDDTDHELLAFMRKALGWDQAAAPQGPSRDTGVLSSAQFIYDNSLDVALDMYSCKNAAEYIYATMRKRGYSRKTWTDEHELHPKSKDIEQLKFIFTMDLLNFSFCSEKDQHKGGFAIEHNGKTYTGYWTLVAALQRALLEGIPITDPYFWVDEDICPDSLIHHVFRSSTEEKMPMIEERIACLREAGHILCERYDGDFSRIVEKGEGSATKLVNVIAKEFPCFRDELKFEGRMVKFYKRAQILVADIWASFDAESYGKLEDIDDITMFADYRVPVILHTLGCISYSPILELHIRDKKTVPSGSNWEIELRGCSIHCVELMRREIIRNHPEAAGSINAILIDFFLYDTAKEMEREVERNASQKSEGWTHIPHHRTRSIWY